MKTIFKAILIVLLAIPNMTFAFVNRLDNNHIEPSVRSDFIKASYFVASSTTVTSTFAGFVGIGLTAPTEPLDVRQTFSLGGSKNLVRFQPTMNAAGTQLAALNLNPTYSGSGTLSAGLGLVGTFNNTSSGLISTATGMQFQILNFSSAGRITNAYGVLIKNPNLVSGAGTISSSVGIRVEDQTNASSTAGIVIGNSLPSTGTNYSLFSSDTSDSYFAGNIGIGTTTTGTALTVNGTITSTSTPPTLSSCGTSPTVVGNNNYGEITTGATATGCTATFATAFPTFGSCVITNQSMSVVNAMTYTDSRTGFTVTQTGLGGSIINYKCDGY